GETLADLHAGRLAAIDVDEIALHADDLTGGRRRHGRLQLPGTRAELRDDLLDGRPKCLLSRALLERALRSGAAERAAAHPLVALSFSGQHDLGGLGVDQPHVELRLGVGDRPADAAEGADADARPLDREL